MTRLEKFLLDEAKAITCSESTVSKYIALGNLIIRLSDHYATKQETEVDLQIIYSVNKCDIYTVFIKGNTKILHYNCKEIKEFIRSYSIIKELQTITPNTIIKRPIVADAIPVIKSTIKMTGLKQRYVWTILRGKYEWTSDHLSNMTQLLLKEFNRNDLFNTNFKQFLAKNSNNL